MNIRDLTYIRSVAKLRHFGQAADACNVSQPALSNQIKKLELELGVTLFERNNRSVKITEVGREIVTLAGEALGVIDNIYSTAQNAGDPLSGSFRMGSIPTISPYLIPDFVKQARLAMPKLNLEFTEDITERLNAALIDGTLDAAILATPVESPKLTAIPIYDEPFWAVYPLSHTLKSQDLIRTKDLPADELLLLTEGHCFRDQTLDVCKIETASQKHSIRATSLETIINMVAAEQGITLVPAMALSGGWMTDKGVLTTKLEDPNAYRRIYLTFRKTFSRKQLIEEVAKTIRQQLGDSVRLVV